MTRRKRDSSEIRKFLEAQQKEPWLRQGERQWWPRFVFHYTDIRNVVTILTDGRLLSRTRAEELGLLSVSSASSSELAGTEPWVKDQVRLYFRPQTPTQYHAEGIKSRRALSTAKYRDAHCPVPVFLLLDSAEVLTLAECRFSDGGLNKRPYRVLSTAAELANLPWKQILHTGRANWTPQITHRRNAEVIVPKELDLSALRFIFCRSAAEKETLLYLLPRQLRNRYQNRVAATTRSSLFFRSHTFVNTARLSSGSAAFFFPPETLSPGPFHLRVDLTDEHGVTRSAEEKEFYANQRLQLNFRRPFAGYTIQLTLDGHLAYGNQFEEIDIPF